MVISVLIFHELVSSVHAVSKTIEGTWGIFASTSLKNYGRRLVPLLFLHKKGCVSNFLRIMLFQPIFSHYFLSAENKSQISESMSKYPVLFSYRFVVRKLAECFCYLLIATEYATSALFNDTIFLTVGPFSLKDFRGIGVIFLTHGS